VGTHFVLLGMGLSAIAYFAFCIVSKVMELSIYEQSIHCQVDKIKIPNAWRFGAIGLSLPYGRAKYAYFRVTGNPLSIVLIKTGEQ
jgi:hypothetical protein